jgi:hypothetical protein
MERSGHHDGAFAEITTQQNQAPPAPLLPFENASIEVHLDLEAQCAPYPSEWMESPTSLRRGRSLSHREAIKQPVALDSLFEHSIASPRIIPQTGDKAACRAIATGFGQNARPRRAGTACYPAERGIGQRSQWIQIEGRHHRGAPSVSHREGIGQACRAVGSDRSPASLRRNRSLSHREGIRQSVAFEPLLIRQEHAPCLSTSRATVGCMKDLQSL